MVFCVCLQDPNESPSLDSAETRLRPSFAATASSLRAGPRSTKGDREWRIISLLNRGVSVVETAEREGLSMSRMRRLVR
jgi:hypothetical protein